ncbi:hypothetical protein ABKN59_009659 [Abortiporus biennis]
MMLRLHLSFSLAEARVLISSPGKQSTIKLNRIISATIAIHRDYLYNSVCYKFQYSSSDLDGALFIYMMHLNGVASYAELSFPEIDLPFNLATTLRPILMGVIVTSLLCGVTCVAFLWILDILHLYFAIDDAHFYLVTNASNPMDVAIIPWSNMGYVACTAVNDFLIRCFFIHRFRRSTESVLFEVDNNIYIPSIAILMILLSCVVASFGFLMCYEASHIRNIFNMRSVTWLFTCGISLIAIVDTMIACLLSLSLRCMKTGFKGADSQVQVLIRYSVQTGALTSIVAIATLISFLLNSRSFVYTAIFLALPKLYLNAFLATLNGREGIRSEMETAISDMNALHGSSKRLSDYSGCHRHQVPGIQSFAEVHKKMTVRLIQIQMVHNDRVITMITLPLGDIPGSVSASTRACHWVARKRGSTPRQGGPLCSTM